MCPPSPTPDNFSLYIWTFPIWQSPNHCHMQLAIIAPWHTNCSVCLTPNIVTKPACIIVGVFDRLGGVGVPIHRPELPRLHTDYLRSGRGHLHSLDISLLPQPQCQVPWLLPSSGKYVSMYVSTPVREPGCCRFARDDLQETDGIIHRAIELLLYLTPSFIADNLRHRWHIWFTWHTWLMQKSWEREALCSQLSCWVVYCTDCRPRLVTLVIK